MAERERSGGILLRLAGAGLLFATGGIHLDLYLTGYRHITTIGPLFLLQVIAAFILALAILVLPRRLVAIAGGLFALSTLGGYILSLWFGLFGFNEVRTTAGVTAGVLEILAFAALFAWAIWFAPDSAADPSGQSLGDRVRRLDPSLGPAYAVACVLAFLALLLAEVSVSSSTVSTSGPAPTGGGGGSVRVTIKDFAFVPATVSAAPGETLIVTNEDGVGHTLTAMPGSSPQGSFDTGTIDPNRTGSTVAPSAPGRYRFYCSVHPFMTGTLVVR